ncbi:MAG: LysM peptidoglycan-binding domain-containing protein [Gammaproteobacteria bacterium]|uniref:LysM peptidoglycan-binding domain-containing protein n=1 Tax=Candidatus Thiopontia autotrophica TaxID=2841688 RepID=A0A8J6TNU5_9GAMM|nr:LysM peptidoglycan-binding domain-containing protein [Candidatus Thiopontia autotrophica]
MKKVNYTALFALPALLFSAVIEAGSFEGYLIDGYGVIVRTPYGDCIHTGFWDKSYAQPECDEILEIRSKYAIAVDAAEKAGLPAPEKPVEIVDIETAKIEELKPTASVEVGLPRSADIPNPSISEIEVVEGDSLWGIASNEKVYGDAALWPLLLCANREQIIDADLIYAGQVLAIPHDITEEAQQAAIGHADNRGDWELGEVEDSDLEYLALHCG